VNPVHSLFFACGVFRSKTASESQQGSDRDSQCIGLVVAWYDIRVFSFFPKKL
jgi:hypothetical protein